GGGSVQKGQEGACQEGCDEKAGGQEDCRQGPGQEKNGEGHRLMARRPVSGLPTPEQILQFVVDSDLPAGKREIARAFGLHGADKIALKELLKRMADEGLIESAP